MVYYDTFKLSQLRLDQKNYRIGPQKTQRDAILAMLEDQKPQKKLARLAKDIIDIGGLSPGEPIWIAPDEDAKGMFVVLEGNRRITALKLLENPALADGTIFEADFTELSKQFASKPIREVMATVFTDREEAKPWQRRRHATAESGVGLESWKPLAKGRADRDHGLGAPRSLAVVEYLEDGSDAWRDIYVALDAKWTTVDRVLNAKAFKETLGVSIDPKTGKITFENGDVAGGKRLLTRVLSAMANPSFDFAHIERVGDRENFVARFADGSVKAKGKSKQSKPATVGAVPAATPATTSSRRPSADSTARESLAPKSGANVMHVQGPRLNPLYKECRLLKVSGNENAAAFLLRVFIELSSEALLIKRKVTIPKKFRDRGKTAWGDFGIPLDIKVIAVADHLDASGNAKTFQQARLALHPTPQTVFSVKTLHGYFHNLQLIPDATSIKAAWDAWEAYLRAIHDDLGKP